MKFDIADSIKDSEKEDWILISGITIVVALLAVMWFFKHKQIKFLVWDKRHKPDPIYREVIYTEDNLDQLLAGIGDG